MSDSYFNAMQALGCDIQKVEARARCKHNCCDGENCMTFFEKQFRRASEADGIDDDRLRELAAAEREGRVVVLPCKIGDPMYMLRGKIRTDSDGTEWERCSFKGGWINESKFTLLALDWKTGILASGHFLTREDAEEALAKHQ